MIYFKHAGARRAPAAPDADEILGFIYQRIEDRHGLDYEAKRQVADAHDARAIAALAVSRMRQIIRRGRDPRACMLAVIAELEHLAIDLTGTRL